MYCRTLLQKSPQKHATERNEEVTLSNPVAAGDKDHKHTCAHLIPPTPEVDALTTLEANERRSFQFIALVAKDEIARLGFKRYLVERQECSSRSNRFAKDRVSFDPQMFATCTVSVSFFAMWSWLACRTRTWQHKKAITEVVSRANDALHSPCHTPNSRFEILRREWKGYPSLAVVPRTTENPDALGMSRTEKGLDKEESMKALARTFRGTLFVQTVTENYSFNSMSRKKGYLKKYTIERFWINRRVAAAALPAIPSAAPP